jgi:hypothetical protein
MQACNCDNVPDFGPNQSILLHQEIDSLRLLGASRFDPVRFFYIDAMARRAGSHQNDVQHILGEKLRRVLHDLKNRFETAQRESKASIASVAITRPHAVADLQELHDAGDFKGVTRRLVTLQSHISHGALTDLARDLEQNLPQIAESELAGQRIQRRELKSAQYFRNTWSKLSAERQLAHALDQAPKNAGPINSHRVVLESLALMRAISPDYLNRFVCYTDTLICLDTQNKGVQPKARSTAADQSGKKVKLKRAGAR